MWLQFLGIARSMVVIYLINVCVAIRGDTWCGMIKDIQTFILSSEHIIEEWKWFGTSQKVIQVR